MKPHNKYSDEILNAFIDGELSSEEEITLYENLRLDESIQLRINQLKRVKASLQDVYHAEEFLQKKSNNNEKLKYSMVAGFVLTIGVFGGWFLHGYSMSENSEVSRITKIEKNETANSWNIVLHVNSNDKYVQKTILDETESLLESFKDSKKPMKVEIVAYGKGVFLFDSEKSKYKERLMSLRSNFSNLSYAVCGRTVKRLETAQGKKIQLISNMTISRSGIYQIIKRQKQGWNYIRI